MQTRSFIGMDVHKATISISITEDGRNSPVRFLGVIPNAPEDVTIGFKLGRPVSINGKSVNAFQAIQLANAIGGKHAIGICSHLVENPQCNP